MNFYIVEHIEESQLHVATRTLPLLPVLPNDRQHSVNANVMDDITAWASRSKKINRVGVCGCGDILDPSWQNDCAYKASYHSHNARRQNHARYFYKVIISGLLLRRRERCEVLRLTCLSVSDCLSVIYVCLSARTSQHQTSKRHEVICMC